MKSPILLRNAVKVRKWVSTVALIQLLAVCLHGAVPQNNLVMRLRFDDSVIAEPESYTVGIKGIPSIRFSNDAKDGMAIDLGAGLDPTAAMAEVDQSYVAVLRPPAIENHFTLSLWFKSAEGANLIADQGLLSWGSDQDFNLESHGIVLNHQGELALSINTHTPNELKASRPLGSFSITEWNHLVYTFDDQAGQATVYLNGLPFLQQSYNQTIVHRGLPIYIGANPTGQMVTFQGLIDDFRLYDRSLSGEEVAGLMNEYLPTIPTSDESDLALRIRLDGDTKVDGNRRLSLVHQPDGVGFIEKAIDGQALDLSANQGSYITVMNPPSLEDQFTLCMWVRLPEEASVKRHGLFSWGPDLSEGIEAHGLFVEEGHSLLSIQNFGGTISSGLKAPLGNIQLSEWTHIAYVYDLPGKAHWLYANGRKLGTTRYIHPIEVKGQNLALGASPIDQLETFPGYMDDIRLYGSILNGSQIRKLMTEHVPSLSVERIAQGQLLSITNPRDDKAEVWGSWDLEHWLPVHVSPAGVRESFFFDNEQFRDGARFYKLQFDLP